MSLAGLEGELHPEVLLGLLQPVQAVLALQVHLRPLAMVPNDSPYPKTWGLKKIRSLACIEAELLPEVLLDLLQPVQAVLALQVHLRPLAMVPNDSPYPKTWGLKKNQVSSSLTSWVTPWRAPPPPQTFDIDFVHLRGVFAWYKRLASAPIIIINKCQPRNPAFFDLRNPPPHALWPQMHSVCGCGCCYQ